MRIMFIVISIICFVIADIVVLIKRVQTRAAGEKCAREIDVIERFRRTGRLAGGNVILFFFLFSSYNSVF